MKLAVAAAISLLLPSVSLARSVLEVAEDKNYPVSKVVTLLRDMQAQLEKEAEEDEEVYDKTVCWCKTNDREKSTAIKEAEARIADLTTTIESTAADSARLKTEIARHEVELAQSEKSLADLTAIREKQAAEFTGEEKDMLQSIKALQSAVRVVSKHHSGGAVLIDAATRNTLAQVMQNQMLQHQSLLQDSITPHQKRLVLGAFMREGRRQLRQPKSQYQPASGEIFGILTQMKETFETNLADSQKEELANAKAFEEQKAAKLDEIKAMRSSLNQKKTQLSKVDLTNAQSKEDLKDTQDSLTIDDKFLIDLKERCKLNNQEWEVRSKVRREEISAIVEAISILNADAARDTFSKTFNPAASFIQKEANRNSHQRDARSEAAGLIWAAAAKAGNPDLSGLAVAAELDAFSKVKQAIDKMVMDLQQKQQAEVQEKDFCVDKLHENDLKTEKQSRKKSNTESKIAVLQTEIKQLSSTLGTLTKEIAEMNLQIKRAGEDRELENKDFQSTVADQRETISLLNKAISVLKAVYSKQASGKKGSVFIQEQRGPPPPPGFKAYAQNGAGGGAIALLTQILGDAKVVQAEALKDEQAAQETYEKFVKDTNDAIESKQAAIVNKSQDKASAEQDLGNAKQDLSDQSTQLQSLENAKIDLKNQCDFLLKNFDLRQQARDEEVEALRQAKAILSGMQTDE
jgi:hypothetical protein